MASTNARVSVSVVTVSVVIAALLLGAACGPRHSPPPPTPPLAGEEPITVGTQFPVESTVLGETRNVTVLLPPGYAEHDGRYPVLYLLDGGVQQDFVPVAGLAALASLSGQYQEFILVGIQSNDRYYELTTPSAVAFDRRRIPHNGGADDFRRFVVDELGPVIDQRYRTSGQDLLMGESLAGFFVVDTFLREPEAFEGYIAVSPSLWWNDRDLARSAATRLARADFPSDRALFLTVGDETDIREPLEIVVAALGQHTPAGLRWWYEPMPAEQHGTIYHPAGLRALRLLLPPR
ncbi:MAG: alpha/beta hydrolase [Myxococcales bacterium]|nr:alpha/beta hydrolase [Myxococcales bacterium]